MKKELKTTSGITLVALVITVIILLILAAITINGLVGENGIITRAKEAKISTELANYKEEVELYKTNKMLENNKFNSDSLTAGKNSLEYESKPENETGNIKTIISDLDNKYINKLIIIKGKLYIMATGDTSELEIKAAQNTGIEVMPYEITEEGELLSSNANLALQGENGTLTIPDIVTSIGEGAFRECPKLKTVEMPDSVIKIGGLTFYGDVNLHNINLSNGITNIQQYTFSNCNSITEINIPEGIEKISDYVFSGCGNLQKITIPESLNSISTSAFSNCPKLKDVQISESNNYFVYDKGIVFNKNKTEMIIILDTAVTGSTFTVPSGITTLGASQLSQYTQITTLNIPSSVTSINPDFINISITQVNIYNDGKNESPYEVYNNAIYIKGRETLIRYFGNESSVTKINSRCFDYCTNLTEIKINKEEGTLTGAPWGATLGGRVNIQWLK